MSAYMELARPLNAAMASSSALLGMLVVMGSDLADIDLLFPVVLGMLTPFFITATPSTTTWTIRWTDRPIQEGLSPRAALPRARSFGSPWAASSSGSSWQP